MKNKYSSKSENNLEIKKENLLFLPRFVLSAGLTFIGAYMSYLSYDTENSDLDFLGAVFLFFGLPGLSGLIYHNFEKTRDKLKSLKIGYRTKKILLWDSGIVKKVEEYSIDNKPISDIEFIKDRFGNLPQRVFFKTPLGELKESYPLEERIAFDNEVGFAFKYKTYKPGDKFP